MTDENSDEQAENTAEEKSQHAEFESIVDEWRFLRAQIRTMCNFILGPRSERKPASDLTKLVEREVHHRLIKEGDAIFIYDTLKYSNGDNVNMLKGRLKVFRERYHDLMSEIENTYKVNFNEIAHILKSKNEMINNDKPHGEAKGNIFDDNEKYTWPQSH